MKSRSKSVAVIHLGKREKSGIQIVQKLLQYEFIVREEDILNKESIGKLSVSDVDAIIVNIGQVSFDYDQLLVALFENTSKVIVNEAEISNKLTGMSRKNWERHLLNKLDSSISIYSDDNKGNNRRDFCLDASANGVANVWILAASIGGPEAIEEFLSCFSGDEKNLFIIVQHMESQTLSTFVKRLNNISAVPVFDAVCGMKIQVPACIVHPVDDWIQFDKGLNINMIPRNHEYAFTPCIDEVGKRLCQNFKEINIAVFSGMSTDGINAAVNIHKKGGRVIVQSESSCVLATIIQGIKSRIQPDYEGSPEQMASFVINHSLR